MCPYKNFVIKRQNFVRVIKKCCTFSWFQKQQFMHQSGLTDNVGKKMCTSVICGRKQKQWFNCVIDRSEVERGVHCIWCFKSGADSWLCVAGEWRGRGQGSCCPDTDQWERRQSSGLRRAGGGDGRPRWVSSHRPCPPPSWLPHRGTKGGRLGRWGCPAGNLHPRHPPWGGWKRRWHHDKETTAAIGTCPCARQRTLAQASATLSDWLCGRWFTRETRAEQLTHFLDGCTRLVEASKNLLMQHCSWKE